MPTSQEPMSNTQNQSGFAKIKHLIGLGNTPQAASTQTTSFRSNQPGIHHTKKITETYQAYGVRISGLHSGNLQALAPSLQAVVLSEKAAQVADEQTQQRYRTSLEAQKQALLTQKQGLELQNSTHEDNIKEIECQINEKKDEIGKLKSSKEKDKLTSLTFYISLFIVLLLSVYLFVFYSSASYSAIYMSGDDALANGLTSHIFNPKAISLAYEQGLFALLLILLLPVVFLGLGFLIHQYSLGKGISKYMKITALICVNFVFDAILAYRISKTMYDLWVMTQLSEQHPYTVSMAFHSGDFWLVIFAGFIAYIIWGLVFSSMMDTYGKMTSNNHLIEKLNAEIAELEKRKSEEKASITSNQQEMINKDAEIAKIENQIQDGITIDYGKIKRCLTEFFGGWLSHLNGLGASHADKAAAQQCFDNTINSLQ